MTSSLQIPRTKSKRQIVDWANALLEEGVPREPICTRLLQIDRSSLSLEEITALMEAHRELSSVMLERNLQGIELEKTGELKEAILLYEANINDKFAGSHPYERLRIIYTKRKDYDNAARVCRAFLDLSDQRADQKKIRFQNHLDKLVQKQQVKGRKPAPKSNSQVEAPSTDTEVERPTHERGILTRWVEGRKSGRTGSKALYRSRGGKSVMIEQYVLDYYAQMGYQGSWTENQYWWAIMALLFWDVIFAKLPGVYTPQFGDFPGVMQDIPIDFFSPEFYPRRKHLIEKRIEELTKPRLFGLSKTNIATELDTAYKRHRNKPCRPMDWQRFADAAQLLRATSLLSTDQLVTIMRRLLENFGEMRRGLPDLFLAHDNVPMFVEVKAERERVADHQFEWMLFLKDTVGVPVEICRVVDA